MVTPLSSFAFEDEDEYEYEDDWSTFGIAT
jgi:hypothetical protein